MLPSRSEWAAALGRTLALPWRLVDPGTCRRCRVPTDGRVLCGDCAANLCGSINPCRRCAGPIGPNLDNADCARCRGLRWSFDRVRGLGEYRHRPLQQVIVAAKSPGGTAAGMLLGRVWTERHGAEVRDAVDAVVPVPRHWRDRLLGGTSASERIAEAVARRLGKPLLLHAVAKSRHTAKQTHLTPTDRKRNLQNAFTARRRLHGSRLLLIDDVLTTGTTAHRVAATLTEAGSTVTVGVIARGVGETVKASTRRATLATPSDRAADDPA